MVQMHEKGVLQPPSTQNIQMMRSKLREEDPNVNMVLRSGVTTGKDKGKQPKEDTWVHKAPTKEPEFDLERTKETFMEDKKSFAEASTSGSKDQPKPGMDPSMLTTFLETCMKLLHDNKAVKGLQELITRCARSGELRVVRKQGKHALHTRREMRLTAQIGEYEMDQVFLDLGSDMNVLPEQTWECMGRPVLQWSPIELRMVNQQKILPMGRLQGVIVDIEEASTQMDFEVIEIVDDRNPYLALLGIDYATNMNGVINLKKQKIIFEKKCLHIVVLLDLAEGVHYTKPVRDDENDNELYYIYQITARD